MAASSGSAAQSSSSAPVPAASLGLVPGLLGRNNNGGPPSFLGNPAPPRQLLSGPPAMPLPPSSGVSPGGECPSFFPPQLPPSNLPPPPSLHDHRGNRPPLFPPMTSLAGGGVPPPSATSPQMDIRAPSLASPSFAAGEESASRHGATPQGGESPRAGPGDSHSDRPPNSDRGFMRQGSQEVNPAMFSAGTPGGMPPRPPNANRPPGELISLGGQLGPGLEFNKPEILRPPDQGLNRPPALPGEVRPQGLFRPPGVLSGPPGHPGVGGPPGMGGPPRPPGPPGDIRPPGMGGPPGDIRPPGMGGPPRPHGPPGDIRPPGMGGPPGDVRPPGMGAPPGDVRPPGMGGPPQPHGPPGDIRPPGMGGPPGDVRPPGMGGPPGDIRLPGMGGPSRPPGEVRPPGMGEAPRPPGDTNPPSSGPPGDNRSTGMDGPPRPSGPSAEVRPQGMAGPPGPSGNNIRPPVMSGPPRMPGGPGEVSRRGGPPLLPAPMRPPGMGGPPGGMRPPGMRGPPANFPPMNRLLMFPDGPRPLMKSPFAYPPGPSPVGDFPPGEVWFEHGTAEGKPYYSHSKTQKTMWERPRNAHVIPFAATQQVRPGQVPVGLLPPGALPSGFLPPSLPGNPQLVPTRVWTHHQTPEGRTYFYNKVTKQSVWEQPKDFELIMPLPLSFSASVPAPVGTGQDLGSIPEKSADGEQSAGRGEAGGVVAEKGSEGGEAGSAEEGEKPVDDAGDDMGDDMDTESPSKAHTPGAPDLTPNPAPNQALLALPPPPPPPQHNFPPPPAFFLPPSMQIPLVAPVPQFEPVLPIHEDPKGPRPIASIPVPGTPWSVVWSSDDRMFFFNATNHVSVWSTPEELVGSDALQDVLDHPPGGKKRPVAHKDVPDSKRLKFSDSEDSDEDGLAIEGVAVVKGDSKPAVDGAEAAEKAAHARATIPLEKRQQDFKDMLLERGVSAFSTWEKELPKFVFDPRYMLLTVKERKATFQGFIRSRTEEERRERKTKLKEMKEQFRSLLEDAKLSPKSSFSEFAARHGKDERFKAVEKMREREQMFTDFLGELKKASNKIREEQKASTKSKAEKVKQDFLALLKEQEEVVITEDSQWKKVKGSFSHDPRYKAVDSSNKREELFVEYVQSLKDTTTPQEAVDPAQMKQERIQASLKEREREVQMSRSAQEKEWDRERDQFRKMEAQQNFKALLVDMVRAPHVQWHDAKRSMKRDHRWELTRLLDHDEKEQIFQEHVLELANKKRLQFRKLLEETNQITLSMPWRKARKLIRDDIRCKNFTDSDYKREVEYDKYQMDKLMEAKAEFRILLRETKLITHKSRDLVNESERHYKDIITVLENDKRYLVLDCIAEARHEMLLEHLEEIHRRGPPPPPTASYPGERLKRPAPS